MVRYITRFVTALCVFAGFTAHASAQEPAQLLRMRAAPAYFTNTQKYKEYVRAAGGKVDAQFCRARAANFPWDTALKGLNLMGYDIHEPVPLKEEVTLFGGAGCWFSVTYVFRMETDVESLQPEKLALQEFSVEAPAVPAPVVVQAPQPPPEPAPAPVVPPPPGPVVEAQPPPPQPAPVILHEEELPVVQPLEHVPLPRPRPRDLGVVKPAVKKIQSAAPTSLWFQFNHP